MVGSEPVVGQKPSLIKGYFLFNYFHLDVEAYETSGLIPGHTYHESCSRRQKAPGHFGHQYNKRNTYREKIMAQLKKPLAVALGAAFFATTIAPLASAEMNPFSAQQLCGGYDLANYGKDAEGKCGEGKCGDNKAKGEGSCGDKKAEGSCGGDKAKGEGSCGGDKAKGEGSCGGDKAKAKGEGKCGEGKCGGS